MGSQGAPALTLVLLPGMDGTGDLFAPFVAALGPGAKSMVVRYPLADALDYPALASLVRRQLPQAEPYVLLGESFSGPIAISIAASMPPGLCGLILCASFARNPRPRLTWLRHVSGFAPVKRLPVWLLSRMLMGRWETPGLRTALASAMARVSSTALRARAKAVLGVDVTVPLRQVKVPALYLRGSQDAVVPASAANHVAEALGAVEVVVLDAPHFLLQTAPEAAASVVKPFVERVTNGWSPRC